MLEHMLTNQDPKARDIMHRGVECIPAHETLDRAAQRMRELDVGALPICDHDRLTGIITDRDIVVRCVAMGHDPAQMRAGDLARGTPRWIDANATVAEVLREMQSHQIRRLPVMEHKRLIGVISEADLAASLDTHQLAEFVCSVATPHR
jgi:CBS domain-containing protein